MNAFLPDYNDPIVSILLILGIIFAISILSYGYTIFKQEKKQKELLKFLNSFESNTSSLEIEKIEYKESIKKPLFLLAHGFLNSGEYSKAIELYRYLIKESKDNTYLSYLAEAYHKAGFIKRSIDIYKKILYTTPRDIKTLYKLELTLEQLKEYQEAKEVIEILKELNQDTSKLEAHLKVQTIINSQKNRDEKFNELSLILKNCSAKWAVLREMFKLNPLNSWSYYQESELNNLIDILWSLDIAQLNLDIIKSHKTLTKLYFAKGLLQKSCNFKTLFAIDLLASAKECENSSADLTFKYICKNCKHSSPLAFYRCMHCHEVYSLKIEVIVAEKREKSSYSLQ